MPPKSILDTCMIIILTVVSSSSVGGVFRFNATSSTKDSNKKHRETAERRKSYNAQSSAKKKPRTYKPYTGKSSYELKSFQPLLQKKITFNALLEYFIVRTLLLERVLICFNK